ncbi:sporulation membrane protein YtrI [Oceanobacillus sp. FSL H7-0719]|uniref:sporulation membrane protein YtrI n=1 Tax=Oceanobacillus sp. FSL H7-0719 TaxID=2954507 RepID=UPI003243C5FB
MHIPPYHKQKSWQRFISGMFFGGVIAYFILLYMYGSMYEDLIKENLEIQERVKALEKQNEVLLEDQNNLQDTLLFVQEIEVFIANREDFKIDRLLDSQLKGLIKEEVNHLIGMELTALSESKALLISSIENKNFKMDDATYQFTVTLLTIAPKLEVIVETELLN